MAKVTKLTHEHLVELLDYDPASGHFTWKVARSNRVKPGSRAGVVHRPSGGRYISIGDEKFMAHRLAFFYVHKRWPNTDVRPLDGNYDHCWLGNLREVSRVELAHQRGAVATNTSGYPGVSRGKPGKWQAKITWNYKQINLGASFDTAEDASEIYEEAARRLRGSAPEMEERIFSEIFLWKRQRAAWKLLQRAHPHHVWGSFENFCRDVTEFHDRRFAMVAIDITRPIGPGNFRWSLPLDAEISSSDDKIAYKRANRQNNRDHYRDKQLRSDYGIDMSDYLRMLGEQNGVCAVCEKAETKVDNGSLRMLSVDHSHATGAVRGLLCNACNNGLGYFCDDPSFLRRAADYLDGYSDGRKAWSTPTGAEITSLPIGQKILMEAGAYG